MTRKRKNQEKRKLLPALAIAGALSACLVPGSWARNYDYSGAELSQKDAAGVASNNYWNGSDDSKDEGVRNGMKALNHLSALDIGGAFHYGYKGYGNYINSKSLDKLDTRAWQVKGSMESINPSMISGQGGSGTGSGGGSGSSMGPVPEPARLPKSQKWADMDRAFLYRGETAEVAAEFEKRSGMSREEFFQHVASAVDSSLSFDDPDLLDKIEDRYQSFVQSVPNKDFRDGIEKMHSMLSLAKKQSLLQEVAAFYFKNSGITGPAENMARGLGGGAPPLALQGKGADAGVGGRAPASSESGLSSAAGAEGSVGGGDGSVSQASTGKAGGRAWTAAGAGGARAGGGEQRGMYLGLEGTHGDELKEFIGEGETIFRVVSKRYRKLAPMLIGKMSSVLNAK